MSGVLGRLPGIAHRKVDMAPTIRRLTALLVSALLALTGGALAGPAAAAPAQAQPRTEPGRSLWPAGRHL